MLTSIVLTGCFDIGINNNKIKTPNGVTVELSNIPFVRYRFKKYEQTELDFISKNMGKFSGLVHIAEVTLSENAVEEIRSIHALSNNIAIFLYVNITDNELVNSLKEIKESLKKAIASGITSLCLKDCASILSYLDAEKMRKEASTITGIPVAEISICGGPCSFLNGSACLTAVKARQILAAYGTNLNILEPSANHEGKLELVDSVNESVNKCGCIRYHVYTQDTPAPKSRDEKAEASSKKENIHDEGKSKATKGKSKGFTKIAW